MTGNVSNITTKMTRSATPIEDTIAPDLARIIVEIIVSPAYIAQDNLIFILYVHRFLFAYSRSGLIVTNLYESSLLMRLNVLSKYKNGSTL